MRIAIISSRINSTEANSPSDLRKAMMQGMEAQGIKYYQSYQSIGNMTHVVCWGWRQGEKLRRNGYQVLVMERGYIGDRFHHTSLGWNGLNNYATFPDYPEDNGERFKAHGGIIKPWKHHGDYALILGQVPRDMSLQGKDLVPWYEEMAAKIKEIHNIPVYFREHPDCKRKGIRRDIEGTIKIDGNLEDNLAGARFTVAYNSNSCLDSILAGVPCVAGDKGTMAWDLCSKSVDNIIYPEREPLAYKIAWTQWTPEEIKEGLPQKRLFECG